MTETSKERLGRLVRDRRKSLGLDQDDIKSRGGPSSASMYLIEDGRAPRMQKASKAGLEKALNWAAGSIDDVLAGDEPSEIMYQSTTYLNSDLTVAPAPGEYPWPDGIDRDNVDSIEGARAVFVELKREVEESRRWIVRRMEEITVESSQVTERSKYLQAAIASIDARLEELRSSGRSGKEAV